MSELTTVKITGPNNEDVTITDIAGVRLRRPNTVTSSTTGSLEVTVNQLVFLSQEESVGTYVFTCVSTDPETWECNSSQVDLATYGISYTGTAAVNDSITVVVTTTSLATFTLSGQGDLISLTVTPSTSEQTFPPQGFEHDGYNEVTVSAVTSSIDNNILSKNIRKGIFILSEEGSMYPIPVWLPQIVDKGKLASDGLIFSTNTTLYFNTAYDWKRIITGNYLVSSSTSYQTTIAQYLKGSNEVGYLAAVRTGRLGYYDGCLFYVNTTTSAKEVLYATKAGTYTVTIDGQTYSVTATGEGWVNKTLSCRGIGFFPKYYDRLTVSDNILKICSFSNLLYGDSGKITLSDTSEVDVRYYTSAQVNPASVPAANIRYGSTILGVPGEFSSDANATANEILEGFTAYAQGQKIVGTYVPLDTSDATATDSDILRGKTAYVNGQKITGTYDPPDLDSIHGLIKPGDSPEILYFTDGSHLTQVMNDFCVAAHADINETITVWRYGADSDQNKIEIDADVRTVTVGVTYDITFIVKIYQEGTIVNQFSIDGSVPCIDVSAYSLNPVSVADELTSWLVMSESIPGNLVPGTSTTITQNGTYTFSQLSSYETVVVDVPAGSGGGSSSIRIEDGELILGSGQGATYLDGDNNLVLGNDAYEYDGELYLAPQTPELSYAMPSEMIALFTAVFSSLNYSKVQGIINYYLSSHVNDLTDLVYLEYIYTDILPALSAATNNIKRKSIDTSMVVNSTSATTAQFIFEYNQFEYIVPISISGSHVLVGTITYSK